MAWPTTLTTTALDSDTDIVKDARPQLLAGLNATNDIISMRGVADGVASLGAGGQIPASQIPNVLTSTGSLNITLQPGNDRVKIQDILNLTPQTQTEITARSGPVAGDIAYSTNGDGGDPAIAVYNGAAWKTIPLVQISDIVDDTSPQLGGDLDVNSRKIVSASNGDITLEPNGSGEINLFGVVNGAYLKNYNEPVYNVPTTSGTVSLDVANGNVQRIVPTGNFTINAFANEASGQSITLIVKQGSSSNYALSAPYFKFANGNDQLTAANGAIDVVHIFFDGDDYIATIVNGYE